MPNIMNDPNDQLNPSFNDLLTKYRNDKLGWNPTPTELLFLNDCYKINTIRKEFVSRQLFPSFSQGKFRILAWKLSFCLIKIIDARPPQYILDGINIGNVTIKDTHLGQIKQDFENELLRLKTQPPFIHDIKLETKTSGLYEKLSSKITPNEKNKGITIKELPLNSHVTAGFTVYPKGKLIIHLGCTFRPIQYSNRGWLEVNSICSKVEMLIQGLANGPFYCTPSPDWLVTHFHFNRLCRNHPKLTIYFE